MLTVVLCGGKGTRLGFDGQKCMAPVAGRPFIDWKIDNLRALGHDDLFFLTGHEGDELEERVHRAGFPFRRDESRGRGVALYEAYRDRVLPPWFWVTYGDTLLSYDRVEVERRWQGLCGHSPAPVQIVTPDGIDYGAMILPRDAFAEPLPFHEAVDATEPWRVYEVTPWHHINTPEDLAETERFLCAS